MYLKLVEDKKEKGFCTILKVGIGPFKIGLVIRGPVFFEETDDIEEGLKGLRQYAKRNNYVFLRINPDSAAVEKFLKEDNAFQQKDFFPSYRGSQGKDFNIYNKPKEQLFDSFQTMCKRKIRYADEINFSYQTIETEEELRAVYALFEELSGTKKFSYRPYKSYREIFKNGLEHALCEVYTATMESSVVCAAFIVKDAQSFNYLSGALVVKGFDSKNSPANKLHYLIMQDCFYKENKHHYNISYSDPASPVYVFKNSFRPDVEEKPQYYTYVANKPVSKIILHLQGANSKTKKRLRSIVKLAQS